MEDKLVAIINNFFGCDAAYFDVNPYDLAMHLIANGVTLTEEERASGRWIHCHGKTDLWYCSICGGKIRYNPKRRTYNIAKLPTHEMNRYCRCCGAKMDMEAEA